MEMSIDSYDERGDLFQPRRAGLIRAVPPKLHCCSDQSWLGLLHQETKRLLKSSVTDSDGPSSATDGKNAAFSVVVADNSFRGCVPIDTVKSALCWP